LFAHKVPINDSTVYDAIQGQHLEMLQWMILHAGCKWVPDSCIREAEKVGASDIVRWIQENRNRFLI
jgi:hypothetical protein